MYGPFFNSRLTEVSGVRLDKSCSESAIDLLDPTFQLQIKKDFEILNYYISEDFCSFFLGMKGKESKPPTHCDCYCKE